MHDKLSGGAFFLRLPRSPAVESFHELLTPLRVPQSAHIHIIEQLGIPANSTNYFTIHLFFELKMRGSRNYSNLEQRKRQFWTVGQSSYFLTTNSAYFPSPFATYTVRDHLKKNSNNPKPTENSSRSFAKIAGMPSYSNFAATVETGFARHGTSALP